MATKSDFFMKLWSFMKIFCVEEQVIAITIFIFIFYCTANYVFLDIIKRGVN